MAPIANTTRSHFGGPSSAGSTAAISANGQSRSEPRRRMRRRSGRIRIEKTAYRRAMKWIERAPAANAQQMIVSHIQPPSGSNRPVPAGALRGMTSSGMAKKGATRSRPARSGRMDERAGEKKTSSGPRLRLGSSR